MTGGTLDTGPVGADLAAWAHRLGVSREAVDVYTACEVVDAHVESFVWTRVFGYDLSRRHGEGFLGGRLWSQADLPRMVEAGMAGAVLSVATNPFRRRGRRGRILSANLSRLRWTLENHGGRVAVVRDHRGYLEARKEGKLACFLAVQGGNALDGPTDLAAVAPFVSRITLVHLTGSYLGGTSSPLGRRRGLTQAGRAYVEAMNDSRILVDLAHVSRQGFWDALAVHDRAQPVVVSHTGVSGVHPSWRNLEDSQIKAVAESGGVVGVMFHCGFLGEPARSGRAEAVVRHMAHLARCGGDDVVAIGSDFDGLIVPPRDLRTVLHLPVLVQRLLEAGFTPERVSKFLGANYLSVLERLGPTPAS